MGIPLEIVGFAYNAAHAAIARYDNSSALYYQLFSRIDFPGLQYRSQLTLLTLFYSTSIMDYSILGINNPYPVVPFPSLRIQHGQG